MAPRLVSGLSFVAEFPGPLASIEQGAGSVVPFERVRVIFRRADGSVALDQMVTFPAGASEVALNFTVALAGDAPATGEPLQLFLRYINAAGDTVFAGGPVEVMATPRRPGDPLPQPAEVPLAYTGPGNEAVTVAFDQDTITVIAGDPFEFTATAMDVSQSVVSAAPLIFAILDPTRATIASTSAGAGTALAPRGSARVRVALAAGGAADTAALVVLPRAGSLQVLAGGAQTGSINAVLPDTIVVRLLATDLQPMAGVSVGVTVTAGGGSVPADTLVSDTLGVLRFPWTLGPTVGAQTLSVGATGVPAVTVTATATTTGAGTIVTTDVTPALDTLVSLGETQALVATSADIAANPMVGSYAWSSRAPNVATVDSLTGLVTAVAPGASWIVALEAGGTRDSARIVVDQRLASVTVTPGARAIYLGASFDFNALAVDGLGVALLSQPAFVWTTQSSAVALIDTAGLAVGVGLGSTQVRATAIGIQGIATLTVQTPITRIAVLRDSIGFVVTDTFTIEALGRSRSYRAVAYDTLDAPMSGVTFAWASSNPSVALMDSTGTTTARAVAAANGITAIRAGADGVVGSASLRVQQRLASIALTPTAATISPAGVTLVTARGRDPGGSFLATLSGVTFVSANTPVAAVNATSGLVTGVANGTALITAFKDSILSDTTTITVGGTVPAIISFGRDTLSIGRSASVSIPIYLSKPFTSAVTVTLAVADTFAFFTTASINIAAGATSGNATLSGRAAGITRIFATDGGGGGGYAGDTASLSVQASARFTSTSYSLVATNETSTQVLLTDPAPVGGTYITYTYGTPDRVSVSPDPAFIPQGQLAANVVITALAGGNSTVTPVATGVTGQASTVNTYPATLDVAGTLYRMGAGQYVTNLYVQVPTNLASPLAVTLASTDTNVVTVVPGVVIAAGIYYVYFDVAGKIPGSVYVRATAPGFSADSVLVQVTTPRVTVCCGSTRTTTSPLTSFTVYARDSVNSIHLRSAPLVVTLSSSDTSIVKLSATTMTILAGQSSASTVSYLPGGEIGLAWIRVSAPGHGTDSVPITVNGPKLSLSFTTAEVGLGQQRQSLYAQLPNNTLIARTVYFQKSDTTIAQFPDSIIIPAGTYYRTFDVDGIALGQLTLIASTAGHEPDTAVIRVSTPRLILSGGGIYDNFRPPITISASVRDSLGSQYPRLTPLLLSYVSTDTSVISVSDTATINAGSSSTSTARVSFIGVGSASVIVSAPGHGADTISFTVRVPKLSLSFATYRIGRRQLATPTSFYVSVPTNVTDTLPVTITQSNAAIDSLTTTAPDIPTGTYYRYFGLAALGTGVDTIIASAPDYLPDTAVVIVTSVRLTVGGLPATRTTTSPPSAFAISAADSVGSPHLSLDTIVVSVVSTNSATMQPLASSYRILPGASSVAASAAFVGPGTATLIVSDSLNSGYGADTTNSVTVTGPSLTITNSTPRLGMRQNNGGTGAYMQVPNNITGTPLVVYLVSTDSAVASVPDSVVIPVGSYYAYFLVTAHDVVGTVQINATAVGYAPASSNQEVTAPRFLISSTTTTRTTQLPTTITVQAADATGAAHAVNEPVIVTLASSSGAVGTIDSTTVTIPTGSNYNNTARFQPLSPGTTQLSATDARVESYRYGAATINVAVTTPAITAWGGTLSLGVGQRIDQNVLVPDYRLAPLLVSLSHKSVATTTPDTLYIPTGTYYRPLTVTGAAIGADTITFTAAGHSPGSSAVLVGLGRIDGIGSWPTTLSTDSVQVTLYPRAPDGGIRSVGASTTFNLSVNANLQFVSGGAGSVPITSVTVPANANYVSFWVKRLSAGTANVSITNANYTPYNSVITVTP